MESNNKLKEISMKNSTCYYVDGIRPPSRVIKFFPKM